MSGTSTSKTSDHIDSARQHAADVIVQWEGVDIDWANVRGELEAHWGAELCNLTEDWTAADEHNYRNLVAREIERAKAVPR